MNRFAPLWVAAMSACLIGLEITTTRIYNVVLWYHFAFLAISVCLFGIGTAGLYLHLRAKHHTPETTERDLTVFAIGFAAAAAVSLVILLQLRLGGLSPDPVGLVKLLLIYVVSAVPFFFGGAFLALAIRRFHEKVGLIYFADLSGAGLGCLAVIPLLSLLGAPGTVFFLGTAATVVALVISWKRSAALRNAALTVGAACLILTVAAPFTGFLDVHYSKGNEEPDYLLSRWNSFSRVIAFERNYEYDGKPVTDVMMEIDGVAHTPINPFDGNPRHSWFHTFDLSALPFSIKPNADILIFGSGGGEHIITALPFEPHHITGVEMNPIVVDLTRNVFGDLSGGILDLPNVTIEIDEGRSFLASTTESYDVIQFTLVDTWAATVAGGYVLTENNVFTTQAFDDYFDRLKPGGLLTFKRWFYADGISVEEYTLRLIVQARTVLEDRGVTGLNDKVFVAGYDEFANVMIKPDGFTLDEVTTLLDFCEEHGLKVLYSPNYEMEPNVFHALIEEPDLDRFLSGYRYDISPVSDNRPFFFYTLRPGDLTKVLSLSYSAKIRNIGPLILLGLLFIVLVITAAFVALPLLGGKVRLSEIGRGRALKFALYFGLIGIGFLLIEIAMMQKFILFLGHPIYSLAVILFSILMFSGVGSFITSRFSREATGRLLVGSLVFLVVYVGVLLFAAPALFDALIGLPAATKALIAMALLLPAGLAMGMPFPLGIGLLAEKGDELIPWMWAVNSAGSVLGSVLAMVLAVNFGFSATIVVGLVCYAVVALLL